MGEQVGATLHQAGESPLQDPGDSLMPSSPTLPRERLTGDLLGQRVLEGVLKIRQDSDLVHELRGLERREIATELVGGPVNDGLKNAKRHVPPHHSGRLEKILLMLGEPVE